MGRLDGKTAAITGGAQGIGRASARLFAREGADVTILDIDEENARSTVDAIRADGGKGRFIMCDVRDGEAVKTCIDKAAQEMGGLDILYNNAGGATPRDDHLLNMPLDEFNQAISYNLFGPFAGCRFAIPHMARAGGGSIINTASIRTQIGTAGADAYTSAKGGIVALTRALALQCAPKKIRAHAIAPGAVLTERVKKLMAAGNDSGPTEAMTARHLLGVGEPEDVACVALFFASDDSRWVTGQILPVDGGASAC